MILIIQRNEPEGLHTSFLLDIKGLQHFGHAADRAGSGLKGDFHKISRRKLPRQLQ
jgi:diphthamide biosynthesis methyltransferase